MADQVVSRADLSGINSSLRSLDHSLNTISNNLNVVAQQVAAVSMQVSSVEQQVEMTKNDLDRLAAEFREFVRQDALHKNLQLAETRLVKIRQELENKFGHYEEVRRRAIGILQAVDTSLVRKETIGLASEEQLLAAPRYWLAPCLVALSAWLNDNRELAERAVMEALRRDDEKTSLFFALVTRRGGRFRASSAWLERYLGQLDPNELKREIVVLVDAFANGIFGLEARKRCGMLIRSWLEELSQKPGFVEAQREQWKNALRAKAAALDPTKFPHLREYSPTWPQLQQALEGAHLHDIIYQYFNFILTQDVVPTKDLAAAVDQLLDVLVREFDAEELPLRREERINELIIQQNGDRQAAEQLFANERVVEERLDFTQLLTNFAMYPAESKASVATQKLAVALSKDWILEAHRDLTAENRNAVPLDIEITVDEWKGVSRDGGNEAELVEQLDRHLQEKKKEALKRNRPGFMNWLSLAAGLGFLWFGLETRFLLVVSAICLIVFVYGQIKSATNKKKIEREFAELFENHKQILLAVLSDIVDYRREYEAADANAVLIGELLEPVTPDQYVYSTHDSARTVI
jgi:hypothetical protein